MEQPAQTPVEIVADPYADAPSLEDQSAALAGLYRTINDKQLEAPDPLIREFLLGQAVYNDRLHLADPNRPEDEYLHEAADLIWYDRQFFTWSLASPGPDSATWSGDDGALEYVRTQWLAAQRNTN